MGSPTSHAELSLTLVSHEGPTLDTSPSRTRRRAQAREPCTPALRLDGPDVKDVSAAPRQMHTGRHPPSG